MDEDEVEFTRLSDPANDSTFSAESLPYIDSPTKRCDKSWEDSPPKHMNLRSRTRMTSHQKCNTMKSSLKSPISGGGDAGTNDGDIQINEHIKFYWILVTRIAGFTSMCVTGYILYIFMAELLETSLWFSNIKEVEREISFRTESGLYYSYYKQLVQAPSITQGLFDLMNDNHTEHTNTVNILARFNIYQEVLLATVYRSFSFLQGWYEPIYFYLNTVFGLQGVLLSGLYLITWQLSGSWMAGLLTAVYYIVNKDDATRVAYTAPLRENFSLPFLWLQIVCVTAYFTTNLNPRLKPMYKAGINVFTFLFAIGWQFNQFILLLQAMSLFGLQVLELIPAHKISYVYCAHLMAMLATCILQFGNVMILAGVTFSFIPAAFIVMALQKKVGPKYGFFTRTGWTLLYIILVFILFGVINFTIRTVAHTESDEHIAKFILRKFGLGQSRDFDVQLYICNGAFTFIEFDTVIRTTQRLLFPPYFLTHVSGIAFIVISFIQMSLLEPKQSTQQNGKSRKKEKRGSGDGLTASQNEQDHVFSERPELAYHIIQAVFFGATAISTLRMKYLWTPYMCVLAAVGLSEQGPWTWLMSQFKNPPKYMVSLLVNTVLICVLSGLLYIGLPEARAELDNLREFYDPDTVDLMEWIKKDTPVAASFAGTMQLLAGVKLCTGRHITNHPHYEDKDLRLRTRQLYQMYARQPPEFVHDILTHYNTSYIILEDSQCLAKSKEGCGLPDIMDIENKMLPEGHTPEEGLKKSNVPRFCDEIRYSAPNYAKLFKKVFSNRTFRVYKVLVKSKIM